MWNPACAGVGLAEETAKDPAVVFGKEGSRRPDLLHYERLRRAGAEPIPLCRAAVWRDALHHGHRRVDAVFQLAHGACRYLAAACGVAIVALASGVQKRLSHKATAAKVACEDGVQECIEAMPDLRANNAESAYLAGLEQKIRAVESRLIKSELGTSVFVVSAGLVLRLGITTTALTGATLLVKGELDVLTFFMFLLVVSRLYDPLEGTLQTSPPSSARTATSSG